MLGLLIYKWISILSSELLQITTQKYVKYKLEANKIRFFSLLWQGSML